MTGADTATPSADPDVVERLRPLRVVSLVEAVSYLLLLVAAVVKRAGGSELGVEILGPIHGILFLAYALLVIRDHRIMDWHALKALGALVLGSLPFGGFWVERRWLPRATKVAVASS